jgi:hypothetical protein
MVTEITSKVCNVGRTCTSFIILQEIKNNYNNCDEYV